VQLFEHPELWADYPGRWKPTLASSLVPLIGPSSVTKERKIAKFMAGRLTVGHNHHLEVTVKKFTHWYDC